MKPGELEVVYEALATAIDAAGTDRADLFLARLSLLMAHELDDAERVLALIESAGRHLQD